jgi:hypothetical protein
MLKNFVNRILLPNHYLKIEKYSSVVILFSVLLLTIESIYHGRSELLHTLFYLDVFVLLFFVIEMIYRLWFFPFKISDVISSIRYLFLKGEFSDEGILERYDAMPNEFKNEEDERTIDSVSKVCLEQFFWLIFDLAITVSSVAAIFFINLFKHPEIVTLFRVVRVFRIIRIFEIHKSLKQTERKIMSVIPTVMIFAVLLALIHFVYAIIGCNLYDFRNFNSIDFSNLYNAYFGLFRALTNGWGSLHSDLSVSEVPGIVTDIYCITFFIFSSMITLNVFLAVMTTQIQDKLAQEKKKDEKENQNESELKELVKTLNEKMDRLEKRLDKKQ